MSDIEYPKVPAIENGSATDKGGLVPITQSNQIFEADKNANPEDKKSSQNNKSIQDNKSPGDIATSEDRSPPPEGSASRTDHDGDYLMGDNGGHNEGQARHTNVDQPKAGDFTKKQSKKYEKQRKVVTRVLNCSSLDYYGILDIEESAKTGEIRKAFRELSLLTHPDQNKMQDATEAFRKISTAYQVLSDRRSRKEYDANSSGYKFTGELDPVELFGEEFGPGAWDEDSDDSASDNDLEEETSSPLKPDKFRQNVYKEATPFVLRFLADHKDSYSEGKIDEFNRKIDAQNQKENIKDKEAFFISTRVFKAISTNVATALSFLQKNPGDEEWLTKLVKQEDQLTKTKRVNSYPADWVLNIPESSRPPMEQLKEKLAKEKVDMQKRFGGGSSRSKRAGNRKDTPGHPSGRGNGEASNSSKDKGKGRADDSSAAADAGGSNSFESTTNQGGSSSTGTDRTKPSAPNVSEPAQSSTAVDKWRPGLTEKGEKILAMAPFEVTSLGKNPVMTRCKFVVLKKNRTNPIVFEDSFDLGEKATQGYLEQIPKSEQVDIRSKKHDYSPKDRQGFIEIIGVTPEPSDNPNRFPSVAVAAKYDHGILVANRSGCRDIWKSKADIMIEDFFLTRGLELPWEKRAKRPGSRQHLLQNEDREAAPVRAGWSTQPRKSRGLDRARSARFPERRRSHSRDSNSSFLSDEGLERLETVERKLEGLAGMEKRLMQSQNNFLQAMTTNMEGLMARMASVRV